MDEINRWIDCSTHRHWLADKSLNLLKFYRKSRLPQGGFGPFDANGRLTSQTADTLLPRLPLTLTLTLTLTLALAVRRL
nr:hypothetical protein [uncultured Halomonas sp.]